MFLPTFSPISTSYYCPFLSVRMALRFRLRSKRPCGACTSRYTLRFALCSFTRRAASRFLNKPPIVSGLAAYCAARPQLWAWPASTDRTFQQKLLLFGKFLGQHCFSPDDCLSYVIRTRRKKEEVKQLYHKWMWLENQNWKYTARHRGRA